LDTSDIPCPRLSTLIAGGCGFDCGEDKHGFACGIAAMARIGGSRCGSRRESVLQDSWSGVVEQTMTEGDWRELEAWVRDSAQQSAAVRRALENLSRWLGVVLDGARPPLEAPPVQPTTPQPVTTEPAQPMVEIGAAIERLSVAWRKSQMPAVEVSLPAPKAAPAAAVQQPREIAPRVRVKAEASRWAVARRELESGSESEALSTTTRNRELVKRARKLGCRELWMLSRDIDMPDSAGLHMLAACYDNLGHALEIAQELDHEQWEDREVVGEVLTVVAESQSAVRSLLKAQRLPEDSDQNDTYFWLSDRTFTLRYFLPRFMTTDTPADPTQWEELGTRLAALRERLSGERARRRAERDARGRLSYHVKRILNSYDGGHTSELAIDDWRKVFAALEELLELGVKPSEIQLREELLPLVEARPLELDVPTCWDRVVDEIDRAIALKELDESAKNGNRPLRERTLAVARVAEHLRGKRVVMVGGANRPLSRQALIDAFELADLDWITSREHSSNENFRASIARDETVLVLLLIRWSSHSYGGLKQMSEEYGKRFVNLPRGYNPAQVAEEILKQVSFDE
jgi:hypothetical protein